MHAVVSICTMWSVRDSSRKPAKSSVRSLVYCTRVTMSGTWYCTCIHQAFIYNYNHDILSFGI